MITHWIRSLGLDDFIAALLAPGEPLRLLAAQVIYVANPLANLLGAHDSWNRWAMEGEAMASDSSTQEREP